MWRVIDQATLPALSLCTEDTLPWGVSDVLAWGRCALQLLSIGEGTQQLHLEVLTPLVLLAPVDEDFVLQGEKVTAHPCATEWGQRAPEHWGAGADKAEPPAKQKTPPARTKKSPRTQELEEKGRRHMDNQD